MNFHAITYAGNGVQVTSGAASANTAVPNTANGVKARYCALVCPSGYVYVSIGQASAAATANDLPIVAGQPPVIVSTQQYAKIAYIQGSAAALLNIIPVEF